MPTTKIEIKKEKLIVVEGIDAKLFFIYALAHLQIDGIQVLSYGGIAELSSYLKALSLSPNYETAKTLLICRDAETDAQAAIQSIRSSLDKNNLPSPGGPFDWADGVKRVGFVLSPGVGSDGGILNGTLEDLCYALLDNKNPIMACVDSFLACAASSGSAIRWPHKSKLHAYFAVTKYVGLKLGEAARAGALDWEKEVFDPYVRMIREM